MICRHVLIISLFVGALAAKPTLAHESDENRDWSKYPAIVTLATTEDVYALGDVHGDYDRCADLLVACNILETKPADPNDLTQVKWKAKKAVFVCMGDMIDKGPDSVKVLMLMRSLQEAAKNEGGRVVITYGNHEAEFLGSPVLDPTNNPNKHTFDKKLTEFVADLRRTTFNGQALDPDQVVDGKDPAGLGVFLRSLPFAVAVNDWFFSHASDTGKKRIDQLSGEIRKGVDDKTKGYDPAKTEAIRGLLDATLADGRVPPKEGEPPNNWWEEGLAQGQTGEDGLLRYPHTLFNDQQSDNFIVRHLVMGHQKGRVHFIGEPGTNDRRKGQLFEKFNGLIFFIDVGMSRWVEDKRNWGEDAGAASKGFLLQIHNMPEPQAFRLDHTGKPVDINGNRSAVPMWRAGFARVPRAKCYLGWNPPLLRDGVHESVETQMERFEIGVHTVTQGQWQEVMGNNPSEFSHTGDQNAKVRDINDEDLKQFPVESVSWDDAQEFIRKLNAREEKRGYVYRLPSEAEWEYACRGGATSQSDCQHHFYFGEPTDKLSSDQANFNGNSPDGGAATGPYLARTTKVGSYAPNKLGLYDMHGNVFQWCEDLNKQYGFGRELRGGGWDKEGRVCRAGFRTYDFPTKKSNDIGFRLVRKAIGPEERAAFHPPSLSPFARALLSWPRDPSTPGTEISWVRVPHPPALTTD
ncbi:MAG TPA: SUMF1/EgtB/PvdO family nonheme iron enzyme [Chthoniobacterales bacterium]|nr:SUMF1/EgtB/PvdO family nonheme iron enzyme [Chthoniobacterales bacterium]